MLRAFGLSDPLPSAPPEDLGVNRRRSTRYRCPPVVAGRIYLPGTGQTLRVGFYDISATGIGLQLRSRLAHETTVFIQVPPPQDGPMVNLLAQVVHCTANVQGRWLAGCEFRQHVSDEALEKLRLGLGKDVES
jgi:c-di-GMP-binding flagellar brake protein YcgR